MNFILTIQDQEWLVAGQNYITRTGCRKDERGSVATVRYGCEEIAEEKIKTVKSELVHIFKTFFLLSSE